MSPQLDLREDEASAYYERLVDSLDESTELTVLAEARPAFYWESQKEQPGEFRVLIGKTEAGTDSVPEASQQAPF